MVRVARRREPGLPCLVAFPEFIGLPLIFLEAVPQMAHCTSWTDALGQLLQAHEDEVQARAARCGVGTVRALLSLRGAAIQPVYRATFARAAARHGCYLVAGTAALPEPGPDGAGRGQVYNTSYFFGPDGALLGAPSKVHPYGLEGAAEGLDVAPAPLEQVRVFPTPFGRVGIAICYDAFQDDVLSTLAAQGASLVVQPSANAHPWNEWQAGDWEHGLWRAVQQSSGIQYGINPMMTGSLFAPGDEYTCQGRSSIVAQVDQTPDGSGYLARAAEQPWSTYTGEELVSAVLELRGEDR
jgi:predicted amidohydrolase